MRNDFLMALNQLCSERGVSREIVIEAVEAALVSAYRRNFGNTHNVATKIDLNNGQIHVYIEKMVVEPSDEFELDENTQILLEEAREIDPDIELGEAVRFETAPPNEFGRIAAQTAKQVILQRIREAERDVLFDNYSDREGELINGTIRNVDSQAVILSLDKAEAILPRSEQIPREHYRVGNRLRAYVMEVQRTTHGPQIIVSRSHRNMLRRLMELEVPEIFNGTVEIKGISREAGARSKVAVHALQEGVDPVGACVGMRGVRIQAIMNELSGEKLDIIEWSSDDSVFVANALSPAKVKSVELIPPKTAYVIVADDQLSLSIGKEGQNARLAAKLTGWRVDIRSVSEAATQAEEIAARREEQLREEETKEDLIAAARSLLEEAERAEQELPLAPSEEEVLEAKEEVSTEGTTVPVEEEAEVIVKEQVEEEVEEEIIEVEPEEELVEEEITEVEEPLEEGEDIDFAEYIEESEDFVDKPGEFEEEEEERKKKHRDRVLIFDERLGRVVSKKKRKPGRKQDWDDLGEYDDDY